jgi:hypothetical protein
MRVRIPLRRGVLDTTLCDKVCQWLVAGRLFYPGNHTETESTTIHKKVYKTSKKHTICMRWKFWDFSSFV